MPAGQLVTAAGSVREAWTSMSSNVGIASMPAAWTDGRMWLSRKASRAAFELQQSTMHQPPSIGPATWKISDSP